MNCLVIRNRVLGSIDTDVAVRILKIVIESLREAREATVDSSVGLFGDAGTYGWESFGTLRSTLLNDRLSRRLPAEFPGVGAFVHENPRGANSSTILDIGDLVLTASYLRDKGPLPAPCRLRQKLAKAYNDSAPTLFENSPLRNKTYAIIVIRSRRDGPSVEIVVPDASYEESRIRPISLQELIEHHGTKEQQTVAEQIIDALAPVLRRSALGDVESDA